MQNVKKRKKSGAATASRSPSLRPSIAGSKKSPEAEARAKRLTAEFIENLNRNAKARVPTS